MSSDKIFQANVVADEFALKIALKALELFKAEKQNQFFLEELTLDNVAEQGMVRQYLCYFKSLVDRTLRIWCEITIWKNYSSKDGVITENSNWRTFKITIEDEHTQWVGYSGGSIGWDDKFPTIKYPHKMWFEPSTPWLEDTATELHPGWRNDGSLPRCAVFCPDRPSGERVVIFEHSAIAHAYVKLTDPDGILHRRQCFPNSCQNCGGEFDATGTCPNDCLD